MIKKPQPGDIVWTTNWKASGHALAPKAHLILRINKTTPNGYYFPTKPNVFALCLQTGVEKWPFPLDTLIPDPAGKNGVWWTRIAYANRHR